jgi:beta-phosphoglucomutase-like phosphatase (HAD superfamily)
MLSLPAGASLSSFLLRVLHSRVLPRLRAKTYCHGCLSRVGIEPPEVTITADDKRLKRGKPFPDPFILAAECLGYDVKRCLVVEDSPSGIKAGVASGATVIAVATSHREYLVTSCR